MRAPNSIFTVPPLTFHKAADQPPPTLGDAIDQAAFDAIQDTAGRAATRNAVTLDLVWQISVMAAAIGLGTIAVAPSQDPKAGGKVGRHLAWAGCMLLCMACTTAALARGVFLQGPEGR